MIRETIHAAGDLVRRANGALMDAWGHREKIEGRVYSPSEQLDSFRHDIIKGINLVKLKALLKSSDSGEVGDGLQLYEQMRQSDAHLDSVVRTRRLSLTGLDWDVVSAAEDRLEASQKNLADEAAAYVKETLTGVTTFDTALCHLSAAIVDNLAVVEIVWQNFEVVDFVAVPSRRLVMQPQSPGVVRMITPDHMTGLDLERPKFIIHIPVGDGLFPIADALMKSQALLWIEKQFAIIDWGTYIAIFGMPQRWATYESNATEAEKKELQRMMKNMGTNAWGIFSKSVQMEIKESSQRGVAPYDALINYCDRKQTVLILGGNLAADNTGGTGTLAAGVIQDEQKNNLTQADIKDEANTIRDQLIEPMCRYKFPGHRVPLPTFKRLEPETKDSLSMADKFIKAQQINLPLSKKHVYDALDIPEPDQDDDLLEIGLPGGLGDGF